MSRCSQPAGVAGTDLAELRRQLNHALVAGENTARIRTAIAAVERADAARAATSAMEARSAEAAVRASMEAAAGARVASSMAALGERLAQLAPPSNPPS